MEFLNVTFASILSMMAMGDLTGEARGAPQVARVSTYVLPPIVGQWQLALDKQDPKQSGCQERYNFSREQLFTGSSGKEFTFGKYLYSGDSDGLPALAVQTTYDNNAPDCSGRQIDQAGDILLAYVKQQGDTMQWCQDSSGKQCTMTLHRVLP